MTMKLDQFYPLKINPETGDAFEGLDLFQPGAPARPYEFRYEARAALGPEVRRVESAGFGLQFGVVVTHLEVVGDVIYLRYKAPPREDPGAPWLSIDGTARLPYGFEMMGRKDQGRAIRHAIVDLLTHEIDEGIFVDGVRTFDPHARPESDRIPFGPVDLFGGAL